MKENKTALIVGLALFATHFGAGNLIFPATLGYMAGDKWPVAVAGFSVTAIVLAMLTFVVICRFDGIGDFCLFPMQRQKNRRKIDGKFLVKSDCFS